MQSRNKPHRPVGIQKKSNARIAAIKGLYAFAMDEEATQGILQHVLDTTACEDEEHKNAPLDGKFARMLAEGVAEHRNALRDALAPHLSEAWKWERLGVLMQALLCCAAYELMHCEKTPYKVIVNEYVSIGGGFFNDEEVSFINGIVDKLARQVRGING